jgi:hypothetical protein
MLADFAEENRMDLFTPVVPPERQHPNFRFLTSIELSGPERAVLQDWATGFQDRDGKFVKEFQTTYNSSFWELYLFAAFKELGCSVDFRYSSPDFVVDSPVGEFVAEATIASHPDGYTPEWERHIDINAVFDVNREELLTVATIRLANAITSKHRKYTNSYAKLPHVQGKPFVICLVPFEQPFFFLQNDLAIRRVLYAFDRHLYQDDRATGTRIVFGATTTESVGKDNGASVPMGLFTRPGMEEVSAVLFSNTATYTKVRALAGEGPYPVLFFAARYNADDLEPRMIELPRPQYSETVLDGLHLCLNPFATHPIDPSLFAERGSSLHTFDSSAEEYVSWAPDGFLFQHSCISFTPENLTSGLRRTLQPPESFKRPLLPEFPEGEMVPVSGQVMCFVDHRLAHYRGWTILIARDLTDDDWGGQAVRGLFRSLPDYQQADKPIAYLPPRDWHASPEEALNDMKRRLDETIDR